MDNCSRILNLRTFLTGSKQLFLSSHDCRSYTLDVIPLISWILEKACYFSLRIPPLISSSVQRPSLNSRRFALRSLFPCSLLPVQIFFFLALSKMFPASPHREMSQPSANLKLIVSLSHDNATALQLLLHVAAQPF